MSKKIAILGGGFTGLSCAYYLKKQGDVEVTIFEKNQDLGGLAAGFSISGGNLEKAYHHLFTTDKDILELAEEIGVGDKLVWAESSTAVVLHKKVYPFTTAIDLLKFSPLSFLNRIRAGVVVLWLRLTRSWKSYVHISALDWMYKAAGKQVTDVIWRPLLEAKFHRFYKNISMAWLWARIHVRAGSRKAGIPGEALGYFNGGFDVFVKKLVDTLKNQNVGIQTGAQISAISKKGEKVILNVGGVQQEFDAVAACVPSNVLLMLLKAGGFEDAAYTQKLSSIEYIGAVCLVFATPQELSPYYWHSVTDADSPFVVWVNHAKIAGTKNFNGKYVYYLAKYAPHDHPDFTADENSLIDDWFAHLKNISPTFDPGQVIERQLFRLKHAQHIVDAGYEQKIPPYETPLSGIYLSNFTQIFPEDRGTNYAVREGKRLAQLIISKL